MDSDPRVALRRKIALQNMAPEADCSPATPVRLRYLICSSLRSGSTLLSEHLLASGLAGAPYEYLNDAHMMAYAERTGRAVTDIGSYMMEIERLRTTGNGVFGMKAHYRQTVRMVKSPDLMRQFLGHFAKVIHITRRDRIAQAVSLFKANQTGLWTSRHAALGAEAAPAPGYDARQIAASLASVVDEDQGWSEVLSDAGSDVLQVTYEDLAHDPAPELARVLGHLGVAVSHPVVTVPRIARQADETSRLFRDRFLADLLGARPDVGSQAISGGKE